MSRRQQRIATMFRQDIEGWRGLDAVTGVRIVSRGEACEHCRTLLGEYRWHEVPAFPPSQCSDAYGCSSWWEPMVDGD